MLYDENDFYINGQLLDCKLSKADRSKLLQLANTRSLDENLTKSLSDRAFESIYAEYARGYLSFTL